MFLREIHLRSFRAHDETRCKFAPGVNLLYGPNGAGKTNVLEAIHYACLTKSFVSSSDRYIVQRGASFAEVGALFARESGRDLRIRLVYAPAQGKQVFINGSPLDRLSDLVGQLPVVVYSPQDHALTAGGPDERRKFIDNLLSQSRPAYLDALLKFRRVLRQRNKLLGRYRDANAGSLSAALEPWNEELILHGTRIIATRAAFAAEFATFLEEAYRQIEDAVERPTMKYETIGTSSAAESDIAATYRGLLDEEAQNERRRGISLVGPHRDELVFRLNGLLVRRYASQGQHRTFGMALKLAKYFYLREHTGEYPLLLLDDVFDHLDRSRSSAFLDLLQSDRIGQTLITATDKAVFTGGVSFSDSANLSLVVESGRIGPQEQLGPHSLEAPVERQVR